MISTFGHIYKTLRHVLIRLWERLFDRIETSIGPDCDFWLVCHSKDSKSAVKVIESINKYSLNPVRTIFIVGNEPNCPTWVPSFVKYIYEGELSVAKVALNLLEGVRYKGWILQQLLKYSGIEYSDRFVTIDCDTVLLKPHLFFSESGTVLRIAYEYSPHYRIFEKKLDVNGGRLFSFTCHMMPYKSELVRALIKKIEEKTGHNWIQYICNYAKTNGMVVAADYDLYARYIIQEKEIITYRPWLNKSLEIARIDEIQRLKKAFPRRNSISFHNSGDRGPLIVYGNKINQHSADKFE